MKLRKNIRNFLIIAMALNFIPMLAWANPDDQDEHKPLTDKEIAKLIQEHLEERGHRPSQHKEEKSKGRKRHRDEDDDREDVSDKDSEHEDVISKKGGLILSEMKKYFSDFNADVQGEDPKTRLVFYGMVYAECAHLFHFSPLEKHLGESCEGAVAIQVTDEEGRGRACVEELKEEGHTCDGDNCYRLSKRLRWDLSLEGDKKIMLYSRDTSKDQVDSRNNCRDFKEDAPIVHKTKKKIAEEAALEKEQEQKDRAKTLKASIANCVDDTRTDSLRRENQELKDIGAITDEIYTQNEEALQKAEENAVKMELKEISAKISKAQSAEDLDTIREELKSWGDDHDEYNNNVAEYLRQTATRYTQLKDADETAWDKARETIDEAKEISGLKESTEAILDKDLRDIDLYRIVALANGGMIQNSEFVTAWRDKFQTVQQEVMTQCYSTYHPTQEGCASAMKDLEMLKELPARATQMDTMRMQNQFGQSNQFNTMQTPGGYGFGGNMWGYPAQSGMNGMGMHMHHRLF